MRHNRSEMRKKKVPVRINLGFFSSIKSQRNFYFIEQLSLLVLVVLQQPPLSFVSSTMEMAAKKFSTFTYWARTVLHSRFLISGFNHSFSTMLLAYVSCFCLNVISPFAQLVGRLFCRSTRNILWRFFFSFWNILADWLPRCFLPHFVFSSWPWRTLPCECPLISNKFFFCFSFSLSFFLPFSMSAREHIIVSPTRRYYCRFGSEGHYEKKYEIFDDNDAKERARLTPSCIHISPNCKSILFIQQWTNTWNFNGVVIVMINPWERKRGRTAQKRFLQGEHNGSKKEDEESWTEISRLFQI